MTVLLALLVLATAAGGLLAASTAPATAATTGEFAHRLAFRLATVDPVVLTADGPRTVTLVGRYTNTGTDPIDDISFRFQRGDALATDTAIRAEVADPSEPVAVVNSDFRPLPGEVAPGASTPFAVTVAAYGDAANSLAIDAPGVYPVMLNVNGVVHRNGSEQEARVGELHVLVTVGSVPTDIGPPTAGGSAAPRPVSILWPLADRPHLAVNGLFADDDLAAEIAPGGRLHAALAAVANADASGASPDLVTLLVDPMLLDELQRMADGYRVLAPGRTQPALPEPTAAPVGGTGARTDVAPTGTAPPDATATGTATLDETATGTGPPARTAAADGTETPRDTAVVPAARSVAGAGQADAAAFLDTVRTLAATHRVALLPYGDADLAALARAGMYDQTSYAVTHGRDIATRVLVRGREATAIMDNLVTDLALPVGGELTDALWSALTELGETGAVLGPGGVIPGDGTTSTSKPATDGVFGVATAHQPPGQATATGRAVLTGGTWAQAFGAILSGRDDTGTDGHDSARAVNLLAAELQVAPPASRTPIVVLPERRFTPSSTGLSNLGALVDKLSPSGVLRAETVETVLAHEDAPPTATLNYSAANKANGLPLRYLQRLAAVRDRIDVLRRALGPSEAGPEPRDVLDPLTAALLPATSSAWRGVADPAAAQLRTVDETLDWLYDGVRINRDTGSYTLASSTAPLLLTVRNTLPYEVSIRVQLVAGEQAGIRATDPGLVTIGAGPRSVPIKLDTEVSRSGTFTVYAQLSGPTGTPWSSPVALTIDSRAYGALTVVLMVVAGGVLVIMVIWRVVQRLRGHGRSPADALVGDDPTSADDAHDAADTAPADTVVAVAEPAADATPAPIGPSHSRMNEPTHAGPADAPPSNTETGL